MSVSLFLSNFLLLIHFPTHWSIDSQDLFNLNTWDSKSSKNSAKILQKFCKNYKSSKCSKSSNRCKSSAKILKISAKSPQNFCKNYKSSKSSNSCKSSAKILKISAKLPQNFCKTSAKITKVPDVPKVLQKFLKFLQ